MQARTFIYGSNFGSISKGRMAKSRCKMTTLWVPRSMGNLPCIKTYGIIFCQHGIFVNYNEPGYWPTFFSAHGEPATGPGVCPLPPTNENLARKNFRGLYMWTSDDWPPKNMMVSTTQNGNVQKHQPGDLSSNQQEWGKNGFGHPNGCPNIIRHIQRNRT